MPNKFGENDKKTLSIAIIKEYGGPWASLCSFFVPLGRQFGARGPFESILPIHSLRFHLEITGRSESSLQNPTRET